MKIDNYLVVFAAHVDSVEKLVTTIATLRHLRDSGIDVCLSTHSTEYLQELAPLVKYINFDNNNEFVETADFLNNCDLIDNTFHKFGSWNYYWKYDFGTVREFFPWSIHSKAAAMLLRNGTLTAYNNHYKWVVYIEYDLPVPLNGYKTLIESKITLLTSLNKKCFHYINEEEHGSWLYGGFFIFEADTIYRNSQLIIGDWFKTKRNWINQWKASFFEAVIQNSFAHSYGTDGILVERIQQRGLTDWGNEDWLGFNKFTTTNINNNSRLLLLHLYPYQKPDGKYGLCLFCSNKIEPKTVSNIKIIINSDTIYERNEDITMNTDVWFYELLNLDGYDMDDTITLTYSVNDKMISEAFLLKYMQNLHDNVLRIEWNK